MKDCGKLLIKEYTMLKPHEAQFAPSPRPASQPGAKEPGQQEGPKEIVVLPEVGPVVEEDID
jgi:hypothetical protein